QHLFATLHNTYYHLLSLTVAVNRKERHYTTVNITERHAGDLMSAIAQSTPSVVHPAAMITGAQIRAARALLGWTSQQLAEASGVSYASISRAEQNDGVPGMRATSLAAIQGAL